MAKRAGSDRPVIVPKEWSSPNEIDLAIIKLQRRISELKTLDIRTAVLQDTGMDDVVESDIRETLRDIFGPNSPEFNEHQYVEIWAGGVFIGMSEGEVIERRERGRKRVIGILNGLINRLTERREDLVGSGTPQPRVFLKYLNLHPRIADVVNDLFQDGYHWEAVFAASKALVNYVKERSGQHHLDGAPLVRKVFSRNNPILSFNQLADQTDMDEQEGMMHLFEGAILGIRNPGGHSFPEGPQQRAVEYLSLISLLAYRVQEAKRRSVTESPQPRS